MKKQIVLFLMAAVCIGAVAEAQNYVTLYTDCNYGGTSQMFKEGQYSLASTRIRGGNLSSFKVPRGMKLIIYTSAVAGQGQKTSFTSEVACLVRDWNDKAYSITVQRDENYNDGGYNPSNNNSSYGMATLYADCNYRGSSKALSSGYHKAYDLGIGNDQLSSFRLPNGWSITLYFDDNFRGRSTTYSNDVSCLPRDWNDQVSSVYINPSGGGNNNSNNSGDVVRLYANCNYGGSYKSLGAGYHKANDLGIGNDQLSSFRVPYGWSITLYFDDNFRGRSTTYSNDVSCLPRDWNDQVSSVYISRNNNNNSGGYNPSYDNPTDYVILYSDENFRGRSITLKVGAYADLNRLGFSPYTLSSMKLPSGWSMMLYDQPNFRGNSYKVLQTKDKFLLSRWNDKAASVVVYRTGGKN